MRFYLQMITVALLLAAQAWPTTLLAAEPLPTVQEVSLERYAGRWYEIARLPMWFERNCIDNITANYTLRNDARIDVVNSCRTEKGQISAHGIAEVPDASTPGRLRVRFAPDWMAWLPMVWGDYWIVDLDPDYRWVLVGAPSRSYLWILARTPVLDANTVQTLKLKAAGLGFNVAEMIDVTNAPE